MKENILTGHTSEHLTNHPEIGVLLHKEVVDPFLRLKELARREGFDLQIASGFRSFERQLFIWEEKLSGRRAIYSHNGKSLLKVDKLSDQEKLNAIIRWSAWPGTSRHHWGTDFDIYDGNTISKENLQLIPEEYNHDGPMMPLTLWLNELIKKKKIDFFRPYEKDSGGIAPEPWHLSYFPLSKKFIIEYNLDLFTQTVSTTPLDIGKIILKKPEYYYQKFFKI